MYIHTLPDAIQREREALLRNAVDLLKIQGNQDLAVQDLAGCKEPEELNIPVLNVHMRPDIFASNQERDGLILFQFRIERRTRRRGWGDVDSTNSTARSRRRGQRSYRFYSELELGVVEVSSGLGEESCGRRWQAFSTWANNHNSRMHVFVHPEDLRRATEIAQYWHVDPDSIVPVTRAH